MSFGNRRGGSGLGLRAAPMALDRIDGAARILFTCLLVFFAGASICGGQGLQVRVLDSNNGMGIAMGQVRSTAGEVVLTDEAGWATLALTGAGGFGLSVSADGYEPGQLWLDEWPADPLSIFLIPIIYQLSTLQVVAEEDGGGVDVLDSVTPVYQLSGEALQDAADQNVGDALERIPGVNASSDGGNLSGVSIRGAGARQTRITIDGQSAVGGGSRGTTRGGGAVGQIPRDFLESINVMKASTPDMDADAVGGSIDFQTSRIAGTRNPRTTASLRGSFIDYGETFTGRAGLTHAQPFALPGADRRFGLLLGLNTERIDRQVDIVNVPNPWPRFISPQTGEPTRTLTRLRAGRRQISNDGTGLLLNTDVQLGRNHQFFVKALWTEREIEQSSLFFNTEFIRGEMISLLPESGQFDRVRLEKQFIERPETSRNQSLTLGSEHRMGDWTLRLAGGYADASLDVRDGRNAQFHTAQREFDASYALTGPLPEVILWRGGVEQTVSDLADPSPYSFLRYERFLEYAGDSELTLQADLQRAWEAESARWTLKGGLKTRMRDAENDREPDIYRPAGAPFSFAEVAVPGPLSVFRDHYAAGAGWSAPAMETLFRDNPELFATDTVGEMLERVAGDFSVSEDIRAGYLMTQRESAHWTVVLGLRMEHTASRTTGYETTIQSAPDGQRVVTVNEITLESDYLEWFPGMHLMYRPNDEWILRTSFTRTLQRPDFRGLSPSTRVNFDERIIRSGNPELRPFTAWAADLGLDWMPDQRAAASLGLFYKGIAEFIVDFEQESEYLGEPGFTRIMPINGSPAHLFGVEAAVQVQLAFLPEPFSGTELSLNYTYADSRARYPNSPETTIMLPEQVREFLNVGLRWRYERWTVNLRTRYRGLQLQRLVRPEEDQFNAPVWNHSLSIGYQINDTFGVSFGASALNRPDNFSYLGDTLHPVHANAGSRMFTLEINARFGGGRPRS